MRGFTLIELVLAVALLGILVSVAVPRIFTSSAGLDAAARKVQSDIAYAQSLAMSRGIAHGVNFTAGAPYILYRSTPATPADDPLTHLSFSEDLSRFNGTQISNNFQVEFDSLGRPVLGGGAGVTISLGGQTKTVTVTANTGRAVLP